MNAATENKASLPDVNNTHKVSFVYYVNSPCAYNTNIAPAYNKNTAPAYNTNTPLAYKANLRNDVFTDLPVNIVLIIIGTLQAFSGLVGLGFGVVEIYLLQTLVGEDVWCNIWVVIVGIIGCVGGFRHRQLTPRIAYTYLAFSTVSIVFMIVLIILVILYNGRLYMLITAGASLVLGICGASYIICVRNGIQRQMF